MFAKLLPILQGVDIDRTFGKRELRDTLAISKNN